MHASEAASRGTLVSAFQLLLFSSPPPLSSLHQCYSAVAAQLLLDDGARGSTGTISPVAAAAGILPAQHGLPAVHAAPVPAGWSTSDLFVELDDEWMRSKSEEFEECPWAAAARQLEASQPAHRPGLHEGVDPDLRAWPVRGVSAHGLTGSMHGTLAMPTPCCGSSPVMLPVGAVSPPAALPATAGLSVEGGAWLEHARSGSVGAAFGISSSLAAEQPLEVNDEDEEGEQEGEHSDEDGAEDHEGDDAGDTGDSGDGSRAGAGGIPSGRSAAGRPSRPCTREELSAQFHLRLSQAAVELRMGETTLKKKMHEVFGVSDWPFRTFGSLVTMLGERRGLWLTRHRLARCIFAEVHVDGLSMPAGAAWGVGCLTGHLICSRRRFQPGLQRMQGVGW